MATKNEMRIRKAMRVFREDGGWEFADPFNSDCRQCGSYDTKQDAVEDRDGLARTYARYPWMIEE